jgi:hypothetical protein
VTPRGPRPDAREALLLRAALSDGDEARAAWRAWRAGADLDRIDQASFRLLPLAWRNLERLGVEDPWDGALRGFYRRAWCENQILFRRLAGVLDLLGAAGVEALVLKGAALASQAYGDAGARPMADADLLVRRRDLERALGRLAEAGWEAGDDEAGRAWKASPRAFRERFSGVGLRQAGDALCVLDVHDRMLHLYARHRVDFPEERLWADAEPFDLAGRRARRLSPEHALLHACFHGFQRQDVGPVRWVADVDRLLRARGAGFRWHRLLADARRARVLAPLRDALPYVAREHGTPVPPSVLRALRRARVAVVERFERAMRLGEPEIVRDYGKSLAPALRSVRERGPRAVARPSTLAREAIRLAYKVPRRHARRALGRLLAPGAPRPGSRSSAERAAGETAGPPACALAVSARAAPRRGPRGGAPACGRGRRGRA